MLSVTHIMPVLVLNTCMDANIQLTINSFRQLFPDISLTFSKIPDISLTAVKFPDISSFSRHVVTRIKVLVTRKLSLRTNIHCDRHFMHDCSIFNPL